MEDEWKKSQTKPIEKQFFKAKATSILCNGKDWYCSVDTAVYKFQVNEVVENSRDIQKRGLLGLGNKAANQIQR